VAVADGMSDSDRSDLGAAIAASEAVTLLRAALDRGADARRLSAADLFQDVAKLMAGAAHQRGIGPAGVRATLVAMVIPTSARPDGSREAWIGHVGDSSVWVRGEAAWRRVAGDEKSHGDNGLRHFLPHSPGAAVDRRVPLAPGDVVAVLTDGVADALDKIPTAARWFADRWRTAPPVASFLLDVSFEARAQQDDRTAVVVWCPEARPSRERR
jgi:serine/threonine protein phosphatase PrpC